MTDFYQVAQFTPPVTAEVDDAHPDRIVVRAALVLQAQVMLIPGATWDDKRRVHTVPLSWAGCLGLRGMFPQVEIGPKLWEWATAYRTQVVEPSMALRSALDVQGDFDPRLRSYQRAGAAWLALVERAILGDDTGTGKTVQTISALSRLDAYGHDVFPACVICPASVKYVWAEHFAEWMPGVDTVVIEGSADKRRAQFEDARERIEYGRKVVVAINWESVRLHSRLAPYGSLRLKENERQPAELNLLPFRTVIADEVHRMKDPKAKVTRAVWAVQHGSRVRYRYSLTGTPIGNHPGDIWALGHGIRPEDYPSHTKFADRYCLTTYDIHSGGLKVVGLQPATRHEFFGIFDPHFRRMPKALVLPFLPPVTYERRDAPMAPKQRKAYDELAKDGFVFLDDDDPDQLLVADDHLAKQTRLLQLSSAMCVIDDAGSVQLTTPSNKLDVMEEIREELDGKPIAVAAVHRRLLMLYAKRLDKLGVPYRMVVGGMPAAAKHAAVADFQEGRVPLLLFTMAAGGEGLTMTRADTLVRLQLSWSLIHNLQTEGRIERIGAEVHERLTLIDIVTPNTREQQLYRTYRAKNARLQEITRDQATIFDALQYEAPGAHDALYAQYEQLEADRLEIMAADDLTLEMSP